MKKKNINFPKKRIQLCDESYPLWPRQEPISFFSFTRTFHFYVEHNLHVNQLIVFTNNIQTKQQICKWAFHNFLSTNFFTHFKVIYLSDRYNTSVFIRVVQTCMPPKVVRIQKRMLRVKFQLSNLRETRANEPLKFKTGITRGISWKLGKINYKLPALRAY